MPYSEPLRLCPHGHVDASSHVQSTRPTLLYCAHQKQRVLRRLSDSLLRVAQRSGNCARSESRVSRRGRLSRHRQVNCTWCVVTSTFFGLAGQCVVRVLLTMGYSHTDRTYIGTLHCPPQRCSVVKDEHCKELYSRVIVFHIMSTVYLAPSFLQLMFSAKHAWLY